VTNAFKGEKRYNIFEKFFASEKKLKPERLKLPNDPSQKEYIHVKKICGFNLQLQTFCFRRKKPEFYKIAFKGKKMFVLSME
jgi:hypothetical protein